MRLRATIKAVFAGVIGWPVLTGTQGVANDIETRLLAAHNRERSALDLAPFRWSPALAREAEAWAENLASEGQLQHATAGSGFGENLWSGTSGQFAPEGMVGDWIAERAHFVRGTFPNVSRTGRFEDVGHYSQIVWRDTAQVGCAIAEGEREDFLVCRYAEPGNVFGEPVY